jgi:hypothetical protein
MSMDLDQDMVAFPADAPRWDGINVRIWVNVSWECRQALSHPQLSLSCQPHCYAA